VNPRHRLAAWVQLLALTAAHPDQPWEAAVLGRGRDRWNDVCISRIPPLDIGIDRRQLALDLLEPMVEIHDRGMREPLPVYRLTSAAFAEAAFQGDDPHEAARAKWESDFNRDGEDKQVEHIRVLGDQVSFAQLLDEQPQPDESGSGWDESEPTRFGRYARRLWADLLGRERISEW
jgi:exodeoxyribonuclease V gamma subunit